MAIAANTSRSVDRKERPAPSSVAAIQLNAATKPIVPRNSAGSLMAT
jgi:hypothetical protein